MAYTFDDRFVEQMTRHQADVYRFIAGLLPNASDVEDLFQETMLVLWRERARYEPGRRFKPWAFGIARNLIRNHFRKHRPTSAVLSPQLLDHLIAERIDLEDHLATRREAMARCIDGLPEAEQDLVRRCYAGVEHIRHVAASTGRTANAVYLQLRRIRHALLDCISAVVEREAAP